MEPIYRPSRRAALHSSCLLTSCRLDIDYNRAVCCWGNRFMKLWEPYLTLVVHSWTKSISFNLMKTTGLCGTSSEGSGAPEDSARSRRFEFTSWRRNWRDGRFPLGRATVQKAGQRDGLIQGWDSSFRTEVCYIRLRWRELPWKEEHTTCLEWSATQRSVETGISG
jgi:hypothetical protein